MDCYLPDYLPSWLFNGLWLLQMKAHNSLLSVLHWCLCQGRFPLLVMSDLRKFLPREVSSRIPANAKHTIAKVQSAGNNNSLEFPSKVSGYYVDMDHVALLGLQLRLLLQAWLQTLVPNHASFIHVTSVLWGSLLYSLFRSSEFMSDKLWISKKLHLAKSIQWHDGSRIICFRVENFVVRYFFFL